MITNRIPYDPKPRNVVAGDIWKWMDNSRTKEEYWLILEWQDNGTDSGWLGLCLSGGDAGARDIITVDEPSSYWEPV